MTNKVEKLSTAESSYEVIREQMLGLSVADQGARWAVRMQEAALQSFGQAITLYIFVAYFETRAEAEQFIDAYAIKAEKLTKAGTEEQKAAGAVTGEFISRMRKIVRSVHGTGKFGKESYKPGIGREATLKVLTGKGGVHQKLAQLASIKGTDERGNTLKGEAVVQQRITDLNAKPPGMESLGKMLALPVPSEVKGEKITDDGKARIIESKAKGVIRSWPEDRMGELVEAFINRLSLSPAQHWKEFGESVRSAWIAGAVEDAKRPARKPEKAKA